MANVEPRYDALRSIARHHRDYTAKEGITSFNHARIRAVQRHNPNGGAYLTDVALAGTVQLNVLGIGTQKMAIYVQGHGQSPRPEAAAAGLSDQEFDLAVLSRSVSPLEQSEQQAASRLGDARGVNPRLAEVYELLEPVPASDLLATPARTEVVIPLR